MTVDDVDGMEGVNVRGMVWHGTARVAPKKVYMRTSTSSGNDKYGAREKLTKRRTWQMAPKRT